MKKILRVGDQMFELASSAVVDGLFATVSYRFETGGRGTRFPIFADRLFSGCISPPDAAAALIELHEIEIGLLRLAPDRAVWSHDDLRRRDDRPFAVNHNARNLRDYFVASNGRPLMAVIQEAVASGLEKNEPVLLQVLQTSEIKRAHLRVSVGLMLLGILWTAVGYAYFRDWVITVIGDETGIGPLIWPAGIFIFLSGVAGWLEVRYPLVFGKFAPHPGKLPHVLALPSLVLYFVLGYLLKRH